MHATGRRGGNHGDPRTSLPATPSSAQQRNHNVFFIASNALKAVLKYVAREHRIRHLSASNYLLRPVRFYSIRLRLSHVCTIGCCSCPARLTAQIGAAETFRRPKSTTSLQPSPSCTSIRLHPRPPHLSTTTTHLELYP